MRDLAAPNRVQLYGSFSSALISKSAFSSDANAVWNIRLIVLSYIFEGRWPDSLNPLLNEKLINHYKGKEIYKKEFFKRFINPNYSYGRYH